MYLSDDRKPTLCFERKNQERALRKGWGTHFPVRTSFSCRCYDRRKSLSATLERNLKCPQQAILGFHAGALTRRHDSDHDRRRSLGGVIHALRGCREIRFCRRGNIQEFLWIEIGQREPRTLNLDHNPVSLLKRVIHVRHIE